MGGYYAQHDGMSQNVCNAIRDQYIPRGMERALPETIEGKVLGLADRLDTIVAFYQAGIIPKGSEDPFALRRHALSVVRIILEGDIRLNLDEAVEKAKAIVAKDGSSMGNDPLSFIIERFRYYMSVTEHLRDDVIHAVTGYETQAHDLVDLAGRMRALQATTSLPEFDPLTVGFNRANNILKKEGVKKTKLVAVDPALFQDDAERELHAQVKSMKETYDEFLTTCQYKEALHCLVQLKQSIDRFFERVMVNVEDSAIRANRLSLLRHVVEDLFEKFADFSRIVVQGR
jgi:glycyl-tRNA synthetase beta chain